MPDMVDLADMPDLVDTILSAVVRKRSHVASSQMLEYGRFSDVAMIVRSHIRQR